MTSDVDVWPEAHARIGDLRGMCSDELPHEQLDVKLSELDDRLYELLTGHEPNRCAVCGPDDDCDPDRHLQAEWSGHDPQGPPIGWRGRRNRSEP